jgi:hypothetical protein
MPTQVTLYDGFAAESAIRPASIAVYIIEMLLKLMPAPENLVAMRASVRYAAAAL